jgi:hypothetical protein
MLNRIKLMKAKSLPNGTVTTEELKGFLKANNLTAYRLDQLTGQRSGKCSEWLNGVCKPPRSMRSHLMLLWFAMQRAPGKFWQGDLDNPNPSK